MGPYARTEREQRWLLSGLPGNMVEPVEIHDRYLTGSTLRLRSMRSASGTVYKLGQKVRAKAGSPERVSLTKRQTVNAQAYDLYLRGQDYLYRLTKRSVERAIQLFEKAIEHVDVLGGDGHDELQPDVAAAAHEGEHGAVRRHHLRVVGNPVMQPVGNVLRRDAQRRAILHQPDVVDVGDLGTAHALVDPAHHVAQDALAVVVQLLLDLLH